MNKSQINSTSSKDFCEHHETNKSLIRWIADNYPDIRTMEELLQLDDLPHAYRLWIFSRNGVATEEELTTAWHAAWTASRSASWADQRIKMQAMNPAFQCEVNGA